MSNHRRCNGVRRRLAFTMVETALSIVLVSGVFVAAMNTAGATMTNRRMAAERIRGQLLAAELMTEIMAQAYEEPSGTVTFGVESGESAANRITLDDVDDYRNLADSPPKFRNGTALAAYSDWSRSVSVQRVLPTNINSISLGESGMKRITVAVKYKGVSMASITALKSGAMPPAGKSNILSATLDYIGKLTITVGGATLE